MASTTIASVASASLEIRVRLPAQHLIAGLHYMYITFHFNTSYEKLLKVNNYMVNTNCKYL